MNVFEFVYPCIQCTKAQTFTVTHLFQVVICLWALVTQHMLMMRSHSFPQLFHYSFRQAYFFCEVKLQEPLCCFSFLESASAGSSHTDVNPEVVSLWAPPVRTCCDAAQHSECSLWHNTRLDMQMGARACLPVGYIWNIFIGSIWPMLPPWPSGSSDLLRGTLFCCSLVVWRTTLLFDSLKKK